MSQLVDIVVQKTGLSQEVAQQAVDAVISFLKTKLPAPIAAEVDNLVAGNTSGLEEDVENLVKAKLGSFFGSGSEAK